VLVTFGVRSNIAALLAGLLFTFSPAFIQTVLKLDAPWSDLPILLFGLGAIALAKNPEGTVHQQAMGFQKVLHKAFGGGGARPVPAATAFAGRHDPRLHPDDPAASPDPASPDPASPDPAQPDGSTAEVAGS
jgi:branched-chain amino acid transport system permease protein